MGVGARGFGCDTDGRGGEEVDESRSRNPLDQTFRSNPTADPSGFLPDRGSHRSLFGKTGTGIWDGPTPGVSESDPKNLVRSVRRMPGPE